MKEPWTEHMLARIEQRGITMTHAAFRDATAEGLRALLDVVETHWPEEGT